MTRSEPSWPPGEGAMARRLRDHDWARTPLGPITGWAPSLKVAVQMLLAFDDPALLCVGEGWTQIYNDGYAALIGVRHPAALGQDARRMFVAADSEATLARVFAGETIMRPDRPCPFRREGEREPAWFDLTAIPVRDEAGAVFATLVLHRETTARVRAEMARAETAARQAYLLALSDALRPLADPVMIQEAACRVLGEHIHVDWAQYSAVDAERGVIANAWDFHRGTVPSHVGTYDLTRFPAHAKAWRAGRSLAIGDVEADPALDEGERSGLRAAAVRAALTTPLVKDGTVVAVMAALSRVPRDWSERDVALLEETAERTWATVEHARAEAMLRESEAQYHHLFDSIDEGFCTIEVLLDTAQRPGDYRFLTVNAAFAQQTGLRDVVGRTVREFVPELEAHWFEAFGRIARTGQPERFEDRAEALGRWYDVYAFRVGRPEQRHVAVLFKDILARKRAEEALRRSEARLRAFVTASADAVYRMSPDWTAMHQLDGHGFLVDTDGPSEDWLATYILPEDRSDVLAAIGVAIRDTRMFELEHRVRRTDGGVGWTLSRAVPILAADGAVAEWFGTASDVTARKEVQAALHASEERFRAFASASSDVIWIADAATGQLVYANAAYEAAFGTSPRRAMTGVDRWLEQVHPDDRAAAAALKARVRAGEAASGTYRVLHGEHETRWLSDMAFPIPGPDGHATRIGGIVRDVTDAQRAADRQEVLVRELQHRTRNLLGVVRSLAQQTVREAGSLDTFQTTFKARLAALSRVQGLLARADADPITLDAVLHAELDALGAALMSERVVMRGPAVRLRKRTVETFALALHELATNARKYGALANDRGRLHVTWRTYADEAGRRLALEWREIDLDREREVQSPVTQPGGYGRELIERALPYVLQARTTYELGETDLLCTIDLPLTERAGPASDRP